MLTYFLEFSLINPINARPFRGSQMLGARAFKDHPLHNFGKVYARIFKFGMEVALNNRSNKY